MRSWRLIGILLFVAMLVLGIVLGDAKSVFNKSVKICLECIGIG